jgi:FtsH-binding integral membrane protein
VFDPNRQANLNTGYGATGVTARGTNLLDAVLGWLAASLVLTAVGVYAALALGLSLPWFIALILMIGLIFAINWAARSGNQPLAVGLFFVFSISEGMFLAPVIAYYLRWNPAAIGNAVLGTAGVFVVAASVVYISNRSFASWGKYLLMALIVGIVLIFASIFLPISQLLISGFLGVVFVGLTIFDFWRVKAARPGDNNALLIAMSLYLDFINIFLILLQIFGGGNRR